MLVLRLKESLLPEHFLLQNNDERVISTIIIKTNRVFEGDNKM
jgi:hypothetical protein